MPERSSILVFWITCCLMLGLMIPASEAQQRDPNQFDVKVKRVKPADLPGPGESKFPSVLRSANVLPRPASLKELRALGETVLPRVVKIAAIHPPTSSLQRDGILLEGHAVWISAESDGSRPVLISNLHWLDKAEAIYALPDEIDLAKKDKLPRARVVGMQSLEARQRLKALRQRKDLTRLVPSNADLHRNLVTLAPDAKETLTPPSSGLMFFDIERQSPSNAYGLSPMLGPSPVQTLFFPIDPAHEELAFYLQCDFRASLGAPIVTIDARLVAITAMFHPADPSRTLVIPPLALRRYVEKVQGIRAAELSEDVEEKP